jgi:phage terminase small subunit
MPKGGARSRSGPLPRTEEQQRALGGRVRDNHRQVRSVGTRATVGAVKPPPYLTRAEVAFWRYYAPLLERHGRLTLECRDVLGAYCQALAIIAEIREEMHAKDEQGKRIYRHCVVSVTVTVNGENVSGKTHPLNIALRNWLETKRKYEADLLLSPATAIRAPGPVPTAQDPVRETNDDTPAGHDFYGEGPTKQGRTM